MLIYDDLDAKLFRIWRFFLADEFSDFYRMVFPLVNPLGLEIRELMVVSCPRLQVLEVLRFLGNT